MYLVLPVCIVTSDVIGVPLESTRSHSTSCECWWHLKRSKKQVSSSWWRRKRGKAGGRRSRLTPSLDNCCLKYLITGGYKPARGGGSCLGMTDVSVMIKNDIVATEDRIKKYIFIRILFRGDESCILDTFERHICTQMLMSILEPGTRGAALDWNSGDQLTVPLCQSTIKKLGQSTVAK